MRHMHARVSPPSALLRALVLGLVLGGPAIAQDGDIARGLLGSEVFVAGAAPVVREPVAGDLFVAGGAVAIEAAVAGDVTAGGGALRLDAAVGGSLQAAAGRIDVRGAIDRDARLAGGQIELGPQSVVGDDLWIAGGQLRLLGAVNGDVHAAGGHVLIDGPIGGDVAVGSGELALGPNARIAGALRHRGGVVRRDPAAQVGGGVRSWPGWGERASAVRTTAPPDPLVGWGWALALALLAALLLALAPGFQARVGRTLLRQPVASVMLGFAWLVAAPLVLLALMVTVIGIPLTLLGVLLYLLLLPLAYVSTAIALGDAVLRGWRADPAWIWRVLAAAALLAALWQALRLPWLGTPLSLLALLSGLGALALQLRRQPAV